MKISASYIVLFWKGGFYFCALVVFVVLVVGACWFGVGMCLAGGCEAGPSITFLIYSRVFLLFGFCGYGIVGGSMRRVSLADVLKVGYI